jgi:microcystin-dependent protein
MHYGPSATVPVGWEILAGQTWSSAGGHDALAARLGLTLPTTAPDGRGKTPRGVAASGTGSTVGGTFGTDTHTITTAQLPAHSHAIDHNHASAVTSDAGTHIHSVSDPGHGHGFTGTAHLHSIGGGGANQFVGANATPGGSIDVVAGAGTTFLQGSTDTTVAGGSIATNTTGIAAVVSGGLHNHSLDLPNHTGTSGDAGSGNTIPLIQAGIALYLIVRVAA